MKTVPQSSRIPEHLKRDVFHAVKRQNSSIIIFGSKARGDDTEFSDIDVLELTDRRSRPYRHNRMNVSVYDEATLRLMAERGSLFVLHLRLEGLIVRDPLQKLASCLASYRQPSTYEPFRQSLRQIADLLDVSKTEYTQRWRPYNELSLYIIRSFYYAQFAEAGTPVFSLDALKSKVARQDFSTTLELKHSLRPAYDLFVQARSMIESLLCTKIHNKSGTAEALITNSGGSNPLMLAFGLRLLGRDSLELSYDVLTFPPIK